MSENRGYPQPLPFGENEDLGVITIFSAPNPYVSECILLCCDRGRYPGFVPPGMTDNQCRSTCLGWLKCKKSMPKHLCGSVAFPCAREDFRMEIPTKAFAPRVLWANFVAPHLPLAKPALWIILQMSRACRRVSHVQNKVNKLKWVSLHVLARPKRQGDSENMKLLLSKHIFCGVFTGIYHSFRTFEFCTFLVAVNLCG